jgi:hypothetical protein
MLLRKDRDGTVRALPSASPSSAPLRALRVRLSLYGRIERLERERPPEVCHSQPAVVVCEGEEGQPAGSVPTCTPCARRSGAIDMVATACGTLASMSPLRLPDLSEVRFVRDAGRAGNAGGWRTYALAGEVGTIVHVFEQADAYVVEISEERGLPAALVDVERDALEPLDNRAPRPAERYPCPCCELPTLPEQPPGTFHICPECGWEDDNVQFQDPGFPGGANEESLEAARARYRAAREADTKVLPPRPPPRASAASGRRAESAADLPPAFIGDRYTVERWLDGSVERFQVRVAELSDVLLVSRRTKAAQALAGIAAMIVIMLGTLAVAVRMAPQGSIFGGAIIAGGLVIGLALGVAAGGIIIPPKHLSVRLGSVEGPLLLEVAEGKRLRLRASPYTVRDGAGAVVGFFTGPSTMSWGEWRCVDGSGKPLWSVIPKPAPGRLARNFWTRVVLDGLASGLGQAVETQRRVQHDVRDAEGRAVGSIDVNAFTTGMVVVDLTTDRSFTVDRRMAVAIALKASSEVAL